jgi:hypothetical protein
MDALLFGFSLGFSLILAIGAQNAFVLKQGLKGEHVFLVCLICAASDAILILIGVSGFHVLVASFPSLVTIARFGGAAFLLVYGLLSFYNAICLDHGLLPSEIKSNSAWQAALPLPGSIRMSTSTRWCYWARYRPSSAPTLPGLPAARCWLPSCFSSGWVTARGCCARCLPRHGPGGCWIS